MKRGSQRLECPACGVDEDASRRPFTNARSISKHISAKAYWGDDDEHKNWIRSYVPNIEFGKDKISPIASQIYPYLQEALIADESEEPSQEEERKHFLVCPLCKTEQDANGHPFSSLFSISKHIAGKARWLNDEHRLWIKAHISDIDFRRAKISSIASRVSFYVQEILKGTGTETLNGDEAIEDFRRIQAPVAQETDSIQEERQRYIRAYEYFWEIERELHSFAARCLEAIRGEDWWKAFPYDLQQQCLQRAHEDDHQVPLHHYIDFRSFGEIVKYKRNRQVFKTAFDSLNAQYKNPEGMFQSKLIEVSRMRNNVMHPLRRLPPSNEDIATLEQFMEFVRKFTSSDIS